MPLDLYKVYKNFYQRSNRNLDNEDLLEMTSLIRNLARNLYRSKIKKTISKKDIKVALNSAKKLYDLEKSYRGFNAYFSLNLVSAIETNNFEINVPKHKMSSWLEEDNHLGTLYVLTAKSRPGQCKLGVTQSILEDRINKYIYRHGYSVDLYFFRHDIPTPFRYEEAITKKYLEHKNSSNSDGDSNEWFFLYPETLKNEILSIEQDQRAEE